METDQRAHTGAQALLMAASVVVVIAGLKAASSLILPFLISLFVAMTSLPLLNLLQKKKVPTALAVVLTLLAIILVVGALASLVGGSVKGFTEAAPRYKARLDILGQQIGTQLAAWGIDPAEDISLDLINPGRALDLATGTMVAVGTALSNVVLVLLTIAFILLEATGFPEKLQVAFGSPGQTQRLANMRREVQQYLTIKTLVSLFTGLVVWASLAIIGVDFPILWGVLAFMLNYIPTLGSIIAAVPPVLLALVQLGLGRALAVAVVFLTVNLVLGNIAEPQLQGRQLGLSSLVVFLSLIFWGWLWGPIGMLLSVPLTMIMKIMLENTEDLRWIAVLLDARPRPAKGG